MKNAENSISEPLGFNIFWGSMPPIPLEGHDLPRLSWNSVWLWPCVATVFWGGGGGGGGMVLIVPYRIWKIVRPSEKILATPL